MSQSVRPGGQIGPEPGLIDLPVAVLDTVEQHHREPVAALGASSGGARRGGGVDIRAGQLEVKFGSQFRQPVVHPPADPTPVACQQRHLRPAHPKESGTSLGLTCEHATP